eukprot:6157812-Pleurochrysis_carterae.AAC.6
MESLPGFADHASHTKASRSLLLNTRSGCQISAPTAKAPYATLSRRGGLSLLDCGQLRELNGATGLDA